MEKTVTWQAFWGYVGYIWREKKVLFLYGVLFFPAFILANYLQVYLPKMIIMELEEKRSITCLGLSVLAFVFVLCLAILLREQMYSRLRYGNRQIARKQQQDYTNKLLYVDYGYLEDQEFLSMRNMVKESIFGGGIGGQGRAHLMDFMPEAVMLIAAVGNVILYLYYLSKISFLLILVLFAVIFLGTVINVKVFRKNERKHAMRSADTWQKLDYVTRKTEDFSMAKDVRLYDMSPWLTGLIDEYLRERLSFKKREMTSRGLGDAVYMLSIGIFMASLLGMLLLGFWDGGIGVSDMVFYANMGPALYHLLNREVSGRCFLLFQIMTEYQRFQTFMEYGEDTGKVDVPVQKEAPSIALEHVSFSYPGAEKEVLSDISLQVRAGEKVAIVGVNGAGKTTLMKLICGLLHPTSGRILLNGVDMEAMEAEERYAWFSCTFQDVQFLPVSIRENITQEIQNATSVGRDQSQKIWHCLEQAGIRKEIEGLPGGLDTLMEKNINENATDFSGGQRQKLILARALYRDAGGLILDEPTAALDALAENDIYEKYAEFAREKTSFFVSHRLSSTRFCDRILLLDGGKIAEEGTHEELLAAGGIYGKMFAMQSKYYQGGEKG
ncbi:MAG: ABC transporter ATP-binding protein [Lachnospiraceae bacterium]|nr:ABC transporter ATP-binding protein [Lachnospiraceae bacterium]